MTKPINEMTLEELAEHAVTLDGWERMDGMGFLVRTLAYGRYSGNRTQYRYTKLRSEGTPAMTNGDPIPDLTDPATLGCVLAMARKVWNDPGLSVVARYVNGEYLFRVVGGHHHGKTFKSISDKEYRHEAHALIAALTKGGK